MDCPHCHSSSTTERAGRTVHGFRCWQCGRRYNKRTGTALNRVPSDIVFLFWRLRYKLSLRDLAEVLLVRGTVFTHEACGIGKSGWRRCSPRRRPGVLGGFAPAIDFADSVRRYPPPTSERCLSTAALNRVRHRMVRQDHRSDLRQRDRQGQHLGQRQGMDQHSGLQANGRGRGAP